MSLSYPTRIFRGNHPSITFHSDCSPRLSVDRLLFVDRLNDPTQKFEEQLTWDSTKNTYVICIGFNPAKADKQIDLTNRMLIKKIKEDNQFFTDVGGYILLNLFSRIAKKKREISLKSSSLCEACEAIVRFLLFYPSVPVILFFGRVKTRFPQSFVDCLHDRGNVFFTGEPDRFLHPAYKRKFEFYRLTIENRSAMRWGV